MAKLAYGQAGPSYALQVASALLGEDPVVRGALEEPKKSKLNFGKAPTVAEAFLNQNMPAAINAAPSMPQEAPMVPSFREGGRAPASLGEVTQEPVPREDQAMYGNYDQYQPTSLYGNPEAYLDEIDGQKGTPESIKQTQRETLADELGRDPQSDRGNAPSEFAGLSKRMNQGIQNYASGLIKQTWSPDQISAIQSEVSADQAKTSALAGLYDRFGNNREKVADYLLEMSQKDPAGPWSGMAGKMKQLMEQGKSHVVQPPRTPTLQDFRPRTSPENWAPGTSLVPADVLLDPRNRLA